MSVLSRSGSISQIYPLNIIQDIDDFLSEELKGPAKFTCNSGQGCKFEEPAMNDLIDQVFGDVYIALTCDSGECLHYSQVPGYTVRSTLSTYNFTEILTSY